MDKNYFPMSQKEASRYEIIEKMLNKEINGSEAAKILKLTTRHIRRLKKKVEKEGIKGLVHGGRGKPSNRRMPDKEKEKIIKIIKTKYPDFGPTLAAEKLEEIYNIKKDPKTIRIIMTKEDLWKPKKKKKQEHLHWRQRRSSYGELVQYDGSYEYWFEDRGKKCCLLAAIDDATGKIIQAKFDYHEGVEPTFNFWKEYVKNHGKPYQIYVDKFSTYSMNQKLARENEDTLTQFERAMNQLNIEVIKANSSQAKGRVERLFETLQDRLIKELRLQNISTIKKADEFINNTYIQKFNEKFSVEARTDANLHKGLTRLEKDNLDSIFSRHSKRTIRNDYTVSYKKIWYQLEETKSVTMFSGEILTVEEGFDGSVRFLLRGKYLNYKKLPVGPKKIFAKEISWVLTEKISYKPAADHPWRKM